MIRLLISVVFFINSLAFADKMSDMVLEVEGVSYEVELADTPAARELLKRLPLQVSMSDLNANEKYGDLPEPLPTHAQAVGSIRTGDVMLFTPTCLVLFYKDFRTIYRYTPIGRVKKPDGLAKLLGRGDVLIRLSPAE